MASVKESSAAARFLGDLFDAVGWIATQIGFDFGEDHFDGIHVRAVWRQIDDIRADELQRKRPTEPLL